MTPLPDIPVVLPLNSTNGSSSTTMTTSMSGTEPDLRCSRDDSGDTYFLGFLKNSLFGVL